MTTTFSTLAIGQAFEFEGRVYRKLNEARATPAEGPAVSCLFWPHSEVKLDPITAYYTDRANSCHAAKAP